MNASALPRDLLKAAEERVAQEKEKLEAACEQARLARTRSDWLTDRPDLLRFDHLIEDIPFREARLAASQSEYNQAYERRMRERIEASSIVPPELERQGACYRWLREKLVEAESENDLASLLNDQRLDNANRSIIVSRIESLRGCEKWITFDGIAPGDDCPTVSYLGHTPACWSRYLELVRQRLEHLEQERSALLRDHLPKIHLDVEEELGELKRRIDQALSALFEAKSALIRRSEIEALVRLRTEAFVVEQTRIQQAGYDAAVHAAAKVRHDSFCQFQLRLTQDYNGTRIEDYAPSSDHPLYGQLAEARMKYAWEVQEAKERVWWDGVSTHPISTVVEKLDNVPRVHIQTILGMLLRLPLNDPHILNERVSAFLLCEHALLLRCRGVRAPVVVAHIGRLIVSCDYAKARDLLRLFPTVTSTPIVGVIAYFRFLATEPPTLSGSTDYRTLSPEDLFLGACYYGTGKASRPLCEQSQ